MRYQDLDHQEIQGMQEIKDQDHDLMIKEPKREIMVMIEAEIIKIIMKRIIGKEKVMLAMKEILMQIIMIIEIEIKEKIEEIEDLHRELDFHHLINLYSQKKILKVIKILNLKELRSKKLTMIMQLNIRKNKSMIFIKGIEMIHGLLKNMIQVKFSNKNKHFKSFAFMNPKDLAQ